MSQQATKSLIMSIIHGKFQSSEFYPYQIQNLLRGEHNIWVSESNITRQFRRWNTEIIAIEPRDRKISKAWTYRLVAK